MIICLGTTPAVQRAMFFGKVKIDGVNRAQAVRESAAGKGINCARVAATIGEKVTALGFVGEDRASFFRKEMEGAGVKCELVEVRPATRVCVTMIDRGAGTNTELVEETARVEEEAWEKLGATLLKLLPSANVLALCGTVAPGDGDGFYARCVRMAREAGLRTIVDGSKEQLLQALTERPTVVKPNRAELGATLGMELAREEEVVRGIGELMKRGAESVIITMGREGAVAADESGVFRVRIPKVGAVNTIGSGDAFTAGVAAGFVRGLGFVDACRLGAACGVANAMTDLAGHVRKKDVEELVGKIGVERIGV